MKLCLLGSCSGTEPQEARHHTSWILQSNDEIFWFDAGENCSYTAHLAGFDLRKSRAVFLSHPHLDHVGGLPNLFWNIGKIRARSGQDWHFELPVYTASLNQVKAMFEFLSETEFPCTSPAFRLHEGVVWDDNITVEAMGNTHLTVDENGVPRSFSFRVTAGNKKIVYSGDIRSIQTLGDWPLKCDIFLMENGHNNPCDVCRYLTEAKAQIGRLIFVHHGRTMLADPEGVIARCREIAPFPVDGAYDNMQIDLR